MAKRSAYSQSYRGPWRRSTDSGRGFLSRLGLWLKRLLVLALLVGTVAVLGFVLFVLIPVNSIPEPERVDAYAFLDQGWGNAGDSADRQRYYYTPQGSSMPQGALVTPLRYSWFVNLEMPLDERRFADPGHLRRYRFIVDAQPSTANPDHLPVGFARHYDSALGQQVLDITCAACHSGEIHALKDGKVTAIRIDGGQAMHAFTSMQRGAFGPTLVASMVATWANPWKFDRFAEKVIGPRYPEGKSALHGELWDTIKAFATQGQNDPFRHLYPVTEGYGRTDALGRIANTVFGDHLKASNYQEATAPVSYPYVWNIWKFDWVQYNGSVSQPLARNIGEALGVGAVLRLTDPYGNPIPAEQRFDSSVIIENLNAIEHTLQKLTPPRWPEELLGAIDQPMAARGKVLFETHCQGCHGPHPADAAEQQATAPDKPWPGTQWKIEVIPVEHIGTDPSEANGFLSRRYDLSAAGLTREEVERVLRPQLTRQLARDVRWYLKAVIDGRIAETQAPGNLPMLLESYPDPDAQAEASIPQTAFQAIAAELGGAAALKPPADAPAWQCDLDCKTQRLLHAVSKGSTDIDIQLQGIDVASLSEGQGLNILGLMIKAKYFKDNHVSRARQQCLEGFGTLDLPQQIAGYKPRPLEGVWATPPFLHNGSVPNLYQMLLPPEQRSARFLVGNRMFDAKHVGYVSEPAAGNSEGFWFDTSIEGNHNSGHAFTATAQQLADAKADPAGHALPRGVIGPLLSDKERYAIIEYLKVHRDLPDTPTDFSPPDCTL